MIDEVEATELTEIEELHAALEAMEAVARHQQEVIDSLRAQIEVLSSQLGTIASASGNYTRDEVDYMRHPD